MGRGDGVSLCFRSLPREIRAALAVWSGTSRISDELSRQTYPSFCTRVLATRPSRALTFSRRIGVHEAAQALGFGGRCRGRCCCAVVAIAEPRGSLRFAKQFPGLLLFVGFGRRIGRCASRFARAKSELLVATPWPGFDASARRRGDHGEHPHALEWVIGAVRAQGAAGRAHFIRFLPRHG